MVTPAVLFQAGTEVGLAGDLSGSPVLALLTLFGAGVLTSLTPCVYPMIPITASVISGTAQAKPKQGAYGGGSRSRT